MLRNSFFAVLTVLAAAASSQAAIMLESSAPTPLDHGLVSFTISAVSTAGEVLNGFSNPNLTAGSGSMGAHQVHVNVTNASTGTRQDHINGATLWSDTNLPYDSYFFASSANSLKAGTGNITESRTGTGATLPDVGAFGPPPTGFGAITTDLGAAAYVFTLASGLQGTTVPFFQLVMRGGDTALLDVNVLDTESGAATPFSDFLIGGDIINGPPTVENLHLGDRTPHNLITGTLPASDPEDDTLTWLLESFVGPGGAIAGASVDPVSGLFSWQAPPLPGALLGSYSATLSASDGNGGLDNGVLSFELVIPEPASISLLGLAMVGAFGFIRRR